MTGDFLSPQANSHKKNAKQDSVSGVALYRLDKFMKDKNDYAIKKYQHICAAINDKKIEEDKRIEEALK